MNKPQDHRLRPTIFAKAKPKRELTDAEREQRAQVSERLKDRPPVADLFGPGIPHLSDD